MKKDLRLFAIGTLLGGLMTFFGGFYVLSFEDVMIFFISVSGLAVVFLSLIVLIIETEEKRKINE